MTILLIIRSNQCFEKKMQMITFVGQALPVQVWCSQNLDDFHHFCAALAVSDDAKDFLQSTRQNKNFQVKPKTKKMVKLEGKPEQWKT